VSYRPIAKRRQHMGSQSRLTPDTSLRLEMNGGTEPVVGPLRQVDFAQPGVNPGPAMLVRALGGKPCSRRRLGRELRDVTVTVRAEISGSPSPGRAAVYPAGRPAVRGASRSPTPWGTPRNVTGPPLHGKAAAADVCARKAVAELTRA
jgi:hypothetical protein